MRSDQIRKEIHLVNIQRLLANFREDIVAYSRYNRKYEDLKREYDMTLVMEKLESNLD